MKRSVRLPALALVAVALGAACGAEPRPVAFPEGGADFWKGPAYRRPVAAAEPPVDGLWGPGSEVWLGPEPVRPVRVPAPAGLKQLQGTWKVVAIESAGQCHALGGPEPESETFLTVEGDSFRMVTRYRTIDGLPVTETGTIRLAPSTDPRSIDLVFRETRLDPCRHGIYALSDGTWTLCLAPNGFARDQPKGCDTTGTPNTTFTLKRVSR